MTEASTAADTVLIAQHGAVQIVTLNRPDKMNAADLAMQQRLVVRLKEAAANEAARALVLTGAGEAFSSGGDRSLVEQIADGGLLDPQALADVHWETIEALLTFPRPVIAAVRGPAIGYAAGLVALCDHVVMGEGAYLCDPHVRMGGAATTGTLLGWPRQSSLVIAKELLMSGRRVYADEALRIGLANVVCAADDVFDAALALAQPYEKLPPLGVAATRSALNRPLIEEAARQRAESGAWGGQ